MKNQYQSYGDHIDVALPYARNPGDGALIGSMFGVCANGGSSGDEDVLVVKGCFTITKRSLESWSVGDKVFWDNTSRFVTTTATANTLIGVAIVAAANPSATGVVRLNGSFI
ncbi:DUF2190 family protein [Bradyrhizobium sp. WYCCWR 13022]|uniref:DUF2190 family protein n=1 Tax=unclassified Bradyrhizobium TaxID=2631580 RepID=UPI00263B1521|nr:DUF2190 family protein [Bradyrhizobium sp. WYCCWR 13022]MDN4982374.1 DUF2190 family protein [Bradyrhizobium sp. WYCCWR 13022]